jgi:hypothetical protein
MKSKTAFLEKILMGLFCLEATVCIRFLGKLYGIQCTGNLRRRADSSIPSCFMVFPPPPLPRLDGEIRDLLCE